MLKHATFKYEQTRKYFRKASNMKGTNRNNGNFEEMETV